MTYLVSDDAAGHASDNITFLEGATNEAVKETVEAHLAVASGDALLEAAGTQLPGAAALLATVREWGAVRRGKSVAAAVEHGLLDTVGRGGGASGGLYVGSAVGSFAGPPGMAIGAVLGAASGALVGGLVATPLKQRKLYFAKRRLDRQLMTLGQSVREQLEAFEQALRTQADESRDRLEQLESAKGSIQRSWRWKLWPTFLQVATVAATDVARQDVDELQARAEQSIQALYTTAEEGDRPLALLATECPALVELAAVDVDDQLEAIAATRDEITQAMRDLALSKRKRDGDD